VAGYPHQQEGKRCFRPRPEVKLEFGQSIERFGDRGQSEQCQFIILVKTYITSSSEITIVSSGDLVSAGVWIKARCSGGGTSQGNKVPYAQRPKAPMGPLKSLPTEADLDDMDDDDLEAMDRELKAALKSAGIEDDSEDEVEGVEQLDEDGQREFRMMKDFLESYKSQGGDSGVIGNLFGRLGEKK
jgi:hypothetical protein